MQGSIHHSTLMDRERPREEAADGVADKVCRDAEGGTAHRVEVNGVGDVLVGGDVDALEDGGVVEDEGESGVVIPQAQALSELVCKLERELELEPEVEAGVEVVVVVEVALVLSPSMGV